MSVAKKARLVLIAGDHHAGTANVQRLHILGVNSDGESAVCKLLHAHSTTVDEVEAAIQKPDK
jgi:hypothetical protein